jgi:hypothetical protein
MSSTQTVPVSLHLRCRLLPAMVVAVGALLGGGSAYAGDAPPKADRLFSEGLNFARVGDCAHAREKFAESYAADPAAGTLINWAVCEEKLGRVATALRLLRLADERLPAGHARISDVKNEVAALRERVPYLRLHPIRPVPAGTVVLKDAVQVDLSSLDQKQPTDPGAHVIEVHAPGHEVRRYDVVLSEGRTVDVAFEPGSPRGAALPVSPAAADRETGDHRLLGWVIGGTGVAAVGVGTVTGLLALSRWNDVRRDCNIDTKTCPTDQGNEASAAGRSLATVSTIAFVAGGVGLLGGAYLLLTARRPSPSATGSSGPFIAISPNGGGIQLSGAF